MLVIHVYRRLQAALSNLFKAEKYYQFEMTLASFPRSVASVVDYQDMLDMWGELKYHILQSFYSQSWQEAVARSDIFNSQSYLNYLKLP